MRSTRLYIVTGGPGAGKSTLIAALRSAGRAVAEEAGRAVIREQIAGGENALPWGDRIAYARAMLERDLAAWRAAQDGVGPMFFDRGIPDIRGYLRLCGETEPAGLTAAIAECGYAPSVFVAPPWEAIFAQNAERTQDFAEAVRTHDRLCETYTELGYRLEPLPLAPVEERVRFVLDRVGAGGN